MRLADPKHNGWLAMTVDHGYFKMDAQVRLVSLLEMYAICAIFLVIKIWIGRRVWKWATQENGLLHRGKKSVLRIWRTITL